MNTLFKTLPIVMMLTWTVAAQADVVVVVSAKSVVASLNKQQVSDLFLGKVNAFPDGSQAVPIEQVEGSAERTEFHAKVTGRSASQLKAYWSKQIFSGTGVPPKEASDSGSLKKMLGTASNMIGYIDKKDVDTSVKVVFTP
jgi:ABC-type phosphate transport system substrate-binding protein